MRLLRDLFSTWLAVIRSPGAFFSALTGARAAPWPFAITVYTLSLSSCFLMHLWSLGHAPVVIALGGVAGLFAGLFSLVLWLLCGGLLLHGGLLVTGARTRPLRETYRCLCYASAPLVIAHVPFIGLALGLSWAFVVGIIAVRHVHRTSAARALVATAVPMLWVLGFVGLSGAAFSSVRSGPRSVMALLPGEHLLICKLAAPQRGDLVAFAGPRAPTAAAIRRVVALGGEVVEGPGRRQTVPPGAVLLGMDGGPDRWELVPAAHILGRAWLIWWSADALGVVRLGRLLRSPG